MDERHSPAGVVARRVGAGVAAACCAVPLSAVCANPVPATFQLAVALLALLAAFNPFNALLVVAGFFPLGTMLSALWGVPWRGGQVSAGLVLAFLVGWFLRLIVRRDPAVPPHLAGPAAVTAVILVASAAMNTLLDGVAGAGPGATAAAALRDFAAHFLTRLAATHPWYAAAEALIALALLCAVAAVLDRSGARPRRLLCMLAIGVTAAAVLNLNRYAEVSLRHEDALAAARGYLSWLRINIHFGDLNAAGSVFAMTLLVMVGLFRTAGRARAGWIAAMVIGLTAALLAGSRVGLASLLLAAGLGAAWEAELWRSRRTLATAAALLLLAALGAGVMLFQFPREKANVNAERAIHVRAEFFSRGLRMAREHPVFGVGEGRFFKESARYSTPGVFGPENAHNDVIQVLAERGLAGLVAFLWLLYAALRPLAGPHPRGAQRTLCIWTAAGLGAYLLSGVGGHPLITFASAVPFWIVLGAGTQMMAASAGGPVKSYRRPRQIGLLAAAALVAVLPFRLHAAWVELGLGVTPQPWQVDGELRYRDVGDAGAMMVPAPVTLISVPLRISGSGALPVKAAVEIAVDEQTINRVTVRSDGWVYVEVPMPVRSGYSDRRVAVRLIDPPPGARLLLGRPGLR